jgi:hypothetical protein
MNVSISLFFCKECKRNLEGYDLYDENNGFFKLWKWYIFTFELALTAEMIIVIYFWHFLWKEEKKTKKLSKD